MRAGQRSYIPGAGHIQILQVEEVRLEDLTEEDAVADGFQSLEELRRELAEIYPNHIAAGRKLFRIIFELLPTPKPASGHFENLPPPTSPGGILPEATRRRNQPNEGSTS